MTDSPSRDIDGPVRVVILSNGSPIADTTGIYAVEVRRAVGSIASAMIEIGDGDMPTSKWDISDGDSFAPGARIIIKAGYGPGEEVIFEGIVVKIGARIDSDNASRLVVHCQDKAVQMTIGRRNANYIDQTDSDIMAKLCSAHGLTADIEKTSLKHGELVQYYCSDWDFLMARAEVNGLMVITDAGTVHAKAPVTSGSAVLKVQWGVDLYEFEADIDARSQIASVTAVAWDPKTQAVVSTSQDPAALNKQGNLASGTLASALGSQPVTLQSPTMLSSDALQAWAKGQQTRAGLARIRGRMNFQGSAKAVPGALVELAGVGERYNGTVFTGAIIHDIRDGEWRTVAEFGLPSRWFAERPDVVAPSASGWLPGAAGLQIGVVLKLDGDPAAEQRIQVKIPVLRAESEGVWARLLQYHASKDFGAFYVPEIGDEVVIGYFNDDPSNPVVLGSLYSSNRAPPYEIAAENNIKALVTRSKARIEIDDKDVIITIKTPADNKIVIDDKDKSILLSDQHGNSIKMNADGITIDSSKDIVMTAKGNISGDAKMKIALSATSDLSAKGLNATVEAQASLTCKGTASAEFSASGTTTVRGAMVMIN
jgi:Rhs element Vgr protein